MDDMEEKELWVIVCGYLVVVIAAIMLFHVIVRFDKIGG